MDSHRNASHSIFAHSSTEQQQQQEKQSSLLLLLHLLLFFLHCFSSILPLNRLDALKPEQCEGFFFSPLSSFTFSSFTSFLLSRDTDWSSAAVIGWREASKEGRVVELLYLLLLLHLRPSCSLLHQKKTPGKNAVLPHSLPHSLTCSPPHSLTQAIWLQHRTPATAAGLLHASDY